MRGSLNDEAHIQTQIDELNKVGREHIKKLYDEKGKLKVSILNEKERKGKVKLRQKSCRW